MDVGESTMPDPGTVLSARRAGLKIPRSRSPIKTYIGSPAVHHRSIVPGSSPTRGSIVTSGASQGPHSVIRKLDFSKGVARSAERTPTNPSPQRRGQHRTSVLASGTTHANGLHSSTKASGSKGRSKDEGEHIEDLRQLQYSGQSESEESYQLMDGGAEEEIEALIAGEAEDDSPAGSPTPEPVQPRRLAGSGSKAPSTKITAGKRGRPGRSLQQTSEVLSEQGAGSSREEDEGQEQPPPKKRRGRPKASGLLEAQPPKKAISKSVPKKKRDSSISKMSSPVQIHRGPPRPRHNNGLFILRRETPDDGFSHTRYGRHVIKPLAYWKNESVVYDESEIKDGKGGNFLLPSIKEVIRAEEVGDEPRRGRRKATKAASAKRKKVESDVEDEKSDDNLAEPWELEPGRIYGDIRTYNPEEEMGTEQEMEAELALSAAAIITRDIPNASFKFAKTLTLPFFGSGVVDLPPGAVKKPKNSRRMQMVFFVFTGRVDVTVNDNTFSIGKGGVWQVPRGRNAVLQINLPGSSFRKDAK
ncbi:MAG: hypothetical protein M1818_004030 [Claussenomyces sp. TS43310]|nr:MAG: hypothetical protein M1818_004030 [Claussenomyces sp. TS43310]